VTAAGAGNEANPRVLLSHKIDVSAVGKKSILGLSKIFLSNIIFCNSFEKYDCAWTRIACMSAEGKTGVISRVGIMIVNIRKKDREIMKKIQMNIVRLVGLCVLRVFFCGKALHAMEARRDPAEAGAGAGGPVHIPGRVVTIEGSAIDTDILTRDCLLTEEE
jgi:hypothetical protein